jgi:hypothetical protein
MRSISVEGFGRPRAVKATLACMLRWISITDLVVDPFHQRST